MNQSGLTFTIEPSVPFLTPDSPASTYVLEPQACDTLCVLCDIEGQTQGFLDGGQVLLLLIWTCPAISI